MATTDHVVHLRFPRQSVAHRLAMFQGEASKTDPPLTRRVLSGYGWFRKLLQGLVELMGIEPMTS
jgi:hypothetical protein